MTTLVLDAEPTIVDLMIDEEKLIVDLEDGRSLIIPLTWYPRLLHGTLADCLCASFQTDGECTVG